MSAKVQRIGDLYPEGTISEIGSAPFEFIEANGFLNLTWARLEFQLFWCVHYLVFQVNLPVGPKRLPRDTKARIKWLHSAVTKGLPSLIDSERLRALLIRVSAASEERNLIVHSRYAGCRDEGKTIVFHAIDVEDNGSTMALTMFTRSLQDMSDLNLLVAECAAEHLDIFRECIESGR